MKIGLLFVTLAFIMVEGNAKGMFVLGTKYSQPTSCAAGSVRTWSGLGLKGACSVVTGLSDGCCGESFEVSLPQISELCTADCISKFLGYWCTRGCSPSNACIPSTAIDTLLTSCNGCAQISQITSPAALPASGNGATADLGTDTSLVLGDTANATCRIGNAPVDTVKPTYSSSAFYWNGVLLNVQNNQIAFNTPNGTLGVLVTVASSLPPKGVVSISLSDNAFPKVLVATQKSQFALWNRTTTGAAGWQQWFNFFVADVTTYVGRMEVALTISNPGLGDGALLFNGTTSATGVSPATSVDKIEQCKNTNGVGETGIALIGQVLVNVNSVYCGCDTCGIYKTGQNSAEVKDLDIRSVDYNMWGASILVSRSINIPNLKSFSLYSNSRLIVGFAWTITKALVFNGDGLDNRLIFQSLSAAQLNQITTSNIRTEISGRVTSIGWVLRNKSKIIATQNASFDLGASTIDVSSSSGIGDSSDPSAYFISGSTTSGGGLLLKGSGWATVGPSANLDMPITLQKTGNPATIATRKMSIQQTTSTYPWNNFTVQVFATGGRIGKGTIQIDDSTAFNIDTSRTDKQLPNGGAASGETVDPTNMNVATNGYLVFKNVGPASRPFNLKGQLNLNARSIVVAEVASNSAWSINFVQVLLLRFVSTTAPCTTAVYGAANQTVVNCPVGRNCSLGIFNNETGSATPTTACYLTLNIAATTAAASTSTLSADTYSLTLERECDWPTNDNQFARAIVEYYSERALTYDNIVIVSKSCGSVTINFRCRDVTIAAADALCRAIKNFAENPNSPLNLALGVAQQKSHMPRGSDSGIFALYSLMFIPCCMACLIVLFYKSKQQKADDQYLQDTATFSSLAHNKGPAPMPPPQGFQPAPPVQYYPEPAYAPQPYPVGPPVYQTGYQPLPTGYPQAAPYGYA